MADFFPAVVYLLCLLTSAACAVLLARGYLASRTRLLLWSAICFALLAANNMVVVVDILAFPAVDLRFLRLAFAFAAISSLLFGLVWDLREDRE